MICSLKFNSMFENIIDMYSIFVNKIHTFATLWLKNGGDSLMLQRLLGHTTLMMTNRCCQAVGCYDAVESHKKFSPVDNIKM